MSAISSAQNAGRPPFVFENPRKKPGKITALFQTQTAKYTELGRLPFGSKNPICFFRKFNDQAKGNVHSFLQYVFDVLVRNEIKAKSFSDLYQILNRSQERAKEEAIPILVEAGACGERFITLGSQEKWTQGEWTEFNNCFSIQRAMLEAIFERNRDNCFFNYKDKLDALVKRYGSSFDPQYLKAILSFVKDKLAEHIYEAMTADRYNLLAKGSVLTHLGEIANFKSFIQRGCKGFENFAFDKLKWMPFLWKTSKNFDNFGKNLTKGGVDFSAFDQCMHLYFDLIEAILSSGLVDPLPMKLSDLQQFKREYEEITKAPRLIASMKFGIAVD